VRTCFDIIWVAKGVGRRAGVRTLLMMVSGGGTSGQGLGAKGGEKREKREKGRYLISCSSPDENRTRLLLSFLGAAE